MLGPEVWHTRHLLSRLTELMLTVERSHWQARSSVVTAPTIDFRRTRCRVPSPSCNLPQSSQDTGPPPATADRLQHRPMLSTTAHLGVPGGRVRLEAVGRRVEGGRQEQEAAGGRPEGRLTVAALT